ncbi:PH domain-containing protein [Rhodococcoides kyotonense]|uniref:PH domain-containing protein n=1 Tax=Rhodococcoides kyotonense TaxID=398843 RepID=A0A239CQK8_9NOCA|nr:PH domain-containing protein [Rhodococcus kyotonensis]SNS22445.1 PH domain-containing protein [Rhodococcus kyotonensis]
MTGPGRWELEVRSRKSARYAIAAAAVLLVAHVTVAVLLRISPTGVYFRTADQLALAGIGVLLAGIALLLTRPRVRVGAEGVAVRNILSERLIEWDLVQGLSFPDGAMWARVDIPDDEFIPVMAIQSNDRDQAVAAVRSFRALEAKYAGAAT